MLLLKWSKQTASSNMFKVHCRDRKVRNQRKESTQSSPGQDLEFIFHFWFSGKEWQIQNGLKWYINQTLCWLINLLLVSRINSLRALKQLQQSQRHMTELNKWKESFLFSGWTSHSPVCNCLKSSTHPFISCENNTKDTKIWQIVWTWLPKSKNGAAYSSNVKRYFLKIKILLIYITYVILSKAELIHPIYTLKKDQKYYLN